jgi:hypothetical protein
MTQDDRDRARQRLAESFVREASRLRFHAPPQCSRMSEEQREEYLLSSLRLLAKVRAETPPSDPPGAHP